MKILYGVQGTGNGHISRANALSDELSKYPDVEIDWILSGRKPNDLFQAQGPATFRRGLTFVSKDGRVQYGRTLLNNNLGELIRDIRNLNLDCYDCLVTDYEPVLSWAAKLRDRSTIGIGHQYAFNYDIPLSGDNVFNRSLLRNFAPAEIGLGLHWHHFDQPILPPICDVPKASQFRRKSEKVVVYLPFEDQNYVLSRLKPLHNYQFMVYSPDLKDENLGHIQTRALSRQGFKDDLATSCAVITNTGFELISECLCLGIKVLTKPLQQQVEQLSNGAALEQLGYAQVVRHLDTATCRTWLEHGTAVHISYPMVHKQIAAWLANGQTQSLETLCDLLWSEVRVDWGPPQQQIAS